MKKLLIILFVVILFNGSAFSKIIELNKCYIPEDDSIRSKDKEIFKSFEESNNYSEYTNKFILKDFNKPPNKNNIIKTYNIPFEDILFKISTKSQTVTRIFVITDEGLSNYRKYLRELKKIKFKLEKEGKEIPYDLSYPIEYLNDYPPKKMWQTSPMKIKQYYDDKLIYEDNEGRTDLWTLNLKTGLATADDGSSILKMICQVGGKKRSHYLDYWWAVILIIAITFFIFTQSGKRLKQIRRK